VLELRGVESGYGKGKTVLFGVDLTVVSGDLALLMGHNGAGKTTLLRTVFGELTPTAGVITFRGEPLRGTSAQRVRGGISYMAGGRAVFAGLTAEENLEVAASLVETNKAKIADRRGFVLEAFPELQKRLGQIAGSMSGGQQRMLAISMAVMQEPQLLLLDEPSLGLSPLYVERLYQSLADIRKRLGISVLVVEQTINPSLLAADHVVILRMGEVVFRGGPDVLADSERLWSML
jgi:branched-chain amino acid transport system ATP-binding protein